MNPLPSLSQARVSAARRGEDQIRLMAKLAKHQRRALRQKVRGWRLAAARIAPGWARRSLGPVVQYADMLLIDHGIFRLAYLNQHRLGDKAWRSAQPMPHQISAARRLGVRTIINLRGPRVCGSYALEQQACARLGIRLENYQVRSRAAPTREEIFGAREMLRRVEYPMLLHCKSGADRAGLMSSLYLIDQGVPVGQAREQLSLKFGHIRHSSTGVLDYFFERFLRDTAVAPIDFFDWVADVYDAEELKRSFEAQGWTKRWASLVTDRVLRRE